MTDNQLNRLLRAAAKAPEASPVAGGEIPPGFETRVIAHWLSSERDSQTLSLALFRRALACACAVAVASFAFSYQTLVASPSPELAIANTALEAGIKQ